MSNSAEFKTYGQLGIIAMSGCTEMGAKVNEIILNRRKTDADFDHGSGVLPESYLLEVDHVRFSNGEGKMRLLDTARGKDIYILADIGNYSCTYEMFGITNHMSPDDHFQDIKRVVSAIDGKSRRTTVIMPRLYASRQDRRKTRESLDCAMALQDLERIGIKNILTFDVHNVAVQNAIPLVSFENLHPFYNIVKQLLESESDVFRNRNSLMVISPDTGGMDRAIYYAGVMNVDVGLFYKRRDYKVIVEGKNPIVEHEYLGRSVEGQDVLIVDDMIASGESIFDIVLELKHRKANKIFIATTFAQFTEGVAKFAEFYEQGLISRVYSTNLSFLSPEAVNSEWFRVVDMSKFIAKLIDQLNYDMSLAPLLDPTLDIQNLFRI